MSEAGADATGLEVLSPMQGWAWSLASVPDPAFAQAALGPGLAIDPLDPIVTAPISGVITTLNPSHHAIVIRHDCGIEVLVHVGIDTVEMRGEGFTPFITVGQRVEAGDPLIECDLDLVAHRQFSLASPVVVVAPDGIALRAMVPPGPIARGARLFVAIPQQSLPGAAISAAAEEAQAVVTIGLSHGIHARPAAALARLLREHGLSGELAVGDRHADLASTVALMRGSFAGGEAARVRVSGPGAATMLEQVAAILRGGFAEVAPQLPTEPTITEARAPAAAGQLRGITGSAGLAAGPAFHHRPPRLNLHEHGADPASESAALAEALRQVESELESESDGGALGQVLAAHRELAADPELRRLADAGIANGHSAGFAWHAASETVANIFAGSGDPRLAERRADLNDLTRRVLAKLSGQPLEIAVAPAGAIVLAADLLPSELADYADCDVAGIVLAGSSPTAHVAIIAAGRGLPLLTAAGSGIEMVPDGRQVVLDANSGLLDYTADSQRIDQVRTAITAAASQAEADKAGAALAACTLDGVRIPVMANLGGLDEAISATAIGADGCGLLRTEFLFLERDSPPTADEQAITYQAIRSALGARPLTIRTLDVGGDKPVRFLPGTHEENPALGMRGLRISLAYPELFDAQLDAVLRAARDGPGGPVHVMVPMVSGLEEWRAVRAAVRRLGGDDILLGLMIETPAAVLLSDQIAAEADFFSIGTNDLTQYILAMDRTNPALASKADPLHPAMLRAIRTICLAAAEHDCPVSVCGSLAGDRLGIPLLLGLGVSSLSVVAAAVPTTKRIVRCCHRGDWAMLAVEACNLPGPAAIRAFVESHSPEGGLCP